MYVWRKRRNRGKATGLDMLTAPVCCLCAHCAHCMPAFHACLSLPCHLFMPSFMAYVSCLCLHLYMPFCPPSTLPHILLWLPTLCPLPLPLFPSLYLCFSATCHYLLLHAVCLYVYKPSSSTHLLPAFPMLCAFPPPATTCLTCAFCLYTTTCTMHHLAFSMPLVPMPSCILALLPLPVFLPVYCPLFVLLPRFGFLYLCATCTVPFYLCLPTSLYLLPAPHMPACHCLCPFVQPHCSLPFRDNAIIAVNDDAALAPWRAHAIPPAAFCTVACADILPFFARNTPSRTRVKRAAARNNVFIHDTCWRRAPRFCWRSPVSCCGLPASRCGSARNQPPRSGARRFFSRSVVRIQLTLCRAAWDVAAAKRPAFRQPLREHYATTARFAGWHNGAATQDCSQNRVPRQQPALRRTQPSFSRTLAYCGYVPRLPPANSVLPTSTPYADFSRVGSTPRYHLFFTCRSSFWTPFRAATTVRDPVAYG